MDTLVWRITHLGRLAAVAEDGTVDGDPELAEHLRARLAEPVVVHRRGTIAGPDRSPDDVLQLRPGDGRYVAARVRVLCQPGTGYEIVGATWKNA